MKLRSFRPPPERQHVLGLWLASLEPGRWKTEHRFHPVRRWRWDWADPDALLAIEVDGMGRAGGFGRHQRPAGMSSDREKDVEGQILGWRVAHVTTRQIANGSAYPLLERWIAAMRSVC